MGEKLKKKEYPARVFFRAKVVCPSCLQRYSEAMEACPRCGFDAYQVIQKFPYEAPVLEDVIDNSGVIDPEWRPDLAQAIARLKKRFPQVGVYFCTVDLDASVKLSEFGFWMMNACRLQVGQQEKDRAWSLLFLIDVSRGMISMTPGYAIEAFIEDSAWEQALRGLSEALADEQFKRAFISLVEQTEMLLISSAKKFSKQVSRS